MGELGREGSQDQRDMESNLVVFHHEGRYVVGGRGAGQAWADIHSLIGPTK